MITVENLEFTYPGNREQTIKGLNFSIGKGEIFGFLGPSGSGKSTTQKILIGILRNYQGAITVMGRELRRFRTDYYEKIGVAFEFPNLYQKFTALENLEFFQSLYSGPTEEPKRLLEMVGLAGDAGARVANFSKGMRMRLNFCRALLNQPEIIFLDEPTSGLDPVNAKIIKEMILAKKAEGKTIFLTTHNMNVAEDICDRTAFLIDGQISLIDSPRQLKINYGKKIIRVEYRDNCRASAACSPASGTDGENRGIEVVGDSRGIGITKAADFELAGIGSNQQFLQLLNQKTIETIHTQEATLEDIFIAVTGRSLG